jgi:hypothetical protein
MTSELQLPVSFTFPELSTRLPAPRQHPHAEEAIAASHAWCREHLSCLLPTDEAMEVHFSQEMALAATIFCPDARGDRVSVIGDVYEYVRVMDNLLDQLTSSGDVSLLTASLAPLISFLEQGPTADSPDYLRELGVLLDRVRSGLTPRQRQRLVTGMIEFAQGCLREGQRQQDGTVTDFASYLQTHEDVSFSAVGLLLTEYGLGIDISAELEACSPLAEACRLAIQYCLLINSLISYRRELVLDAAGMNPITIFMRYEGLSLQQSVDRLCEKIHAIERAFYTAHGETLASPVGQRQQVRAYLHALEMFCAGCLRWSLICQPYNGLGHEWNGTTSGTMILHPDHTEYLPQQ